MPANIIEFKGEVAKAKDYSDNAGPQVRVLSIRPPEGLNFVFKPGQFVMISMDAFKLRSDSTKLRWAAYSICSQPSQREIELCVRLKDTPGLSNYVKQNAFVGSQINARGPYGVFLLKEDAPRYSFFATGTGIAPIICMIRHLSESGRNPDMELFFGFRGLQWYLYGDELEALAKSQPNFKLYPSTSSTTDPNWKGRTGFVQDQIRQHDFEKPEERTAYICGVPEMVKQVRELLPQKGFRKENVKTEEW